MRACGDIGRRGLEVGRLVKQIHVFGVAVEDDVVVEVVLLLLAMVVAVECKGYVS